MTFEVSKGAAAAVLYSVLAVFTLLAIASAGWFGNSIGSFWTLKKNTDGADYFLAARKSAGTTAIALSFFASGMGAWVVYGTTEMGANPQLSWLGVLGYSIASALPAILIGTWLGPIVLARTDDKAFSTSDFGRQRYGRVMQVSIAGVSVFYMFIYLVAELTSISNVFALLTGDFSKRYGVVITVVLGIFTMAYTTMAGLPASIVTDKFQGVIMACLVIILVIAVPTQQENDLTRDEFARASNWTSQGFKAMVSLIIAIASAELFNQATWQRVWAAESPQAMRNGFTIGAIMGKERLVDIGRLIFCVYIPFLTLVRFVLSIFYGTPVFFLMMFFGVMGMIAYALDPEAYDNFEKLAFLAFFDLLEPLSNGWHIVVLILVTALAASSVDSLQNGMTSIISHDLVKLGWSPTTISRILMVAVNVPAFYLASEKYDVISLFLVADLVCATSVLPVFLGLQREDYGIFKAPTELGAFSGCVAGVVTVLINGAVNDVDGGIFEYFWLKNEGICALCGTKTMVSFIVTPVASALITYVASALDLAIRGDRARRPLIPIPFDKDDLDTEDGGSTGEKAEPDAMVEDGEPSQQQEVSHEAEA